MNPAVLLAVLCGAATVVGIALVVAGALGIQPADHPHRPGRALTFLRGSPRRWLAAVVVTVVVWVLTGWVAVGLAAGFALWGLPALFGAQRRAGREIARVAAMEEWVRRLSDVLVSGVGLGQAVLVAARTAPEPLAAELAALESRINARWPLQSALVSFADDVADPAGDLVATALILA
ncbi:MAG TPA: hypothetical protein VFN19_10995, partial [Candidatus Nanopelagicales bacterium]|nr:hypothetical protein [Candidatus Nanopelagicales bacterium]